MAYSDRLLNLFLVFFCALISATTAQAVFFFQWPEGASQCGVQQLYWSNAQAPFTAFVIPVGASPFIYDIPDDAYDVDNQTGFYQIQLQLNAGTSYVVLMSDGTGFGTGGSSQIRRVEVSGRTSCLYTASANQTDKAFGFSVSGVAEQCERGFELAWDGPRQYEPYNFTVVPLDQSFWPYDVILERGRSSMSDWKLNMTTGARFTIMMNNALGYGTGGTAGIYSVNLTTSGGSSCIKQSIGPTGPWPVGLATNTLPAATLPATAPAGEDTALSGGAIAGVVIAVLAGLAILLFALWFLLRRRRRSRIAAQKVADYEVDLADGYDDSSTTGMTRLGNASTAHAVEPYPIVDPFQQDQISNSAGSSFGEADPETMTAAGSTALGAGVSGQRSSNDEDSRASGPGVAGPLPSKTYRSLDSSSSPAPSSQSAHIMKAELLGRAAENTQPLPQPPAPTSGMRIVNHDDPYGMPALPAVARYDDALRDNRLSRRNQGIRRSADTGPTYRRHEDAGRLPVTRREEEFVDLPPLYTDVPRDGPDFPQRPQDAQVSPVSTMSRGPPGEAHRHEYEH